MKHKECENASAQAHIQQFDEEHKWKENVESMNVSMTFAHIHKIKPNRRKERQNILEQKLLFFLGVCVSMCSLFALFIDIH